MILSLECLYCKASISILKWPLALQYRSDVILFIIHCLCFIILQTLSVFVIQYIIWMMSYYDTWSYLNTIFIPKSFCTIWKDYFNGIDACPVWVWSCITHWQNICYMKLTWYNLSSVTSFIHPLWFLTVVSIFLSHHESQLTFYFSCHITYLFICLTNQASLDRSIVLTGGSRFSL